MELKVALVINGAADIVTGLASGLVAVTAMISGESAPVEIVKGGAVATVICGNRTTSLTTVIVTDAGWLVALLLSVTIRENVC